MSDPIDFVLNLDDSAFIKRMNSAMDSAEGLGASLASVGKMSAVIGAGYLALKTAFDMTLQAEELASINAQFDILSRQVGIAGNSVRQAMDKAADGLISGADLTKLANKAMIQLGESSARMPEIMEMARKASVITGEDVAASFERLSQAIATGQTRQLKQLGIIIDSEKAYRDYAKSLGIAENSLSEAGKRQAIMNEALRQGKEKLGEVDTSLKENTDAWTKFKNLIGDVGEIASIAVQKVAGKPTAAALETVTGVVNQLRLSMEAAFGSPATQAAANVELLKGKIKDMEAQLTSLQSIQKGDKFSIVDFFSPTATSSAIEGTKQKIAELRQELSTLEAKSSQGAAPGGSGSKENPADQQKVIQNAAKFKADIMALEQQIAAARTQTITTVEQAEALAAEERVRIQQQTAARIAEVEASASMSPEQKAQMRAELEQAEAFQMETQAQREMQLQDQVFQNRIRNAQLVMEQEQSVGAAIQLQALRSADAWRKSGGDAGNAVTAFTSNAAKGFAAMGAENARVGEEMKKMMFGMLADWVDAKGKAMMLEAFDTWPVVRWGTLAAGAGLIALGGFLRSQGGSGGSSAPGGSPGGGGSAGESSRSASTERPEVQEQQKQKSVTINVQGSYFETEQTRTRLVELIRESSDATDFTVRSLS